MNEVFTYARNQAIGMQFEPFRYSNPTATYVWEPNAVIKRLCVLTASTFLGRLLFQLFVKAEAR